MSNHTESLDCSSENFAYQLAGKENFQNNLSIDVDYALQSIVQQLKHYATLSTTPSQLEEIYGLKESEKLSDLLASWASEILVNQPSISLLEDTLLHGAQGAYATENNHIYLAQSLADRDKLTGLNKVLLEEYGHALDVYFNASQDTPGDEGEWFSLAVTGVSLTQQDRLRLRNEQDQATLWMDNQSIAVEQSTVSLDFNRDQKPDILWRDAASGQNVAWFMGGTNNTQLLSGASLTTVGGGWNIKGVSDFNGDNQPDLLWRDAASGQNVVWFMGGTNNTQLIGSANLTTVGGSWDIKGISDFNGDNQPDLLWRDAASGQNVVWFMGGTNNTQVLSGASLTTVGGGWDIRGISDFNGDNRPDLLWRDAASGQNVVWFMGGTNNTQVLSGASLTTVGGGWDIKGISDFNGDNQPDLLWRDAASGQNVVWFMGGANNTQLISGASLTTVGGGWNPILASWMPQNKPDLYLSYTYAPESVTAGDTITLSGTVRNQGNATASASTLRYWLSDDSTFNANSDTQLGSDYVGTLMANGGYSSQSISVNTAGWGTGTKYLFFEADGSKSVVESNEVNNVTYRTITINPLKPDLTVTILPPMAVLDSTTFSVNVENVGSATSGSSYLRYWLSNDTILDTNADTLLASDYVPSLSPNALSYQSFNVDTNTWGSGTKYLFFEADGYNSVAESNESNNAAYIAITVNSPKADLVIQSQTAPTSATVGDTISISAYTKNIGGSTAGSSSLRYWLSDDTTLNTLTDRALSYNSVGSLAAGASEYDSYSFTYDASWGTGTKYILFQADGYSNVGESNEGNNVAYRAITINPLPQPDLVVTNLVGSTSITVGDSVSLSYYIKNQGAATTGSSSVYYWLSSDTVLSSDDYFLRSKDIGSIGVGSSVYDSVGFVYSSALGTGQKYILVEADGYRQVTESNENNNVAYQAITIYPPLPDLTIVTPSAPNSATAGNSITVSAYTKNQGNVASSSNYVHYWLSDDSTLSTSSDRYLGNSYVDSLAAGSFEYDALTFTYNLSWGTGNKYILFQADGYGQITESDESNNVFYKAITINPPTQPDLTITNQYAPTSVTVDDSVTVSAYTKNQGTGSAGAHYLRYYLSNDTILSSDDYDLGYDSVASLAAGSSESDSLTFTYSSSWGTGNKYILFQADGYDYVSESNESNNVVYKAIIVNAAGDWFSQNLLDAGLITMARTKFSDSKLDRNDMISIFRDAKDGSGVDSNELTDLRKLVSSYSYLNMDDYVRVLSNKIANGDTANTNSGIGNLYSGSSATQLENLVGKWFLGADRPDLIQTSHEYRFASGSLFQNGVSYTDINQGSLGDCYFLASLAGAAYRSTSMIQNMFIVNGDNTYTVKFFNNGVADYVTVDSYLPTNSYGYFIYSHQRSSTWGKYDDLTNELWVMLAEKAYAQMSEAGWLRQDPINAYESIESGSFYYAIGHITGQSATWHDGQYVGDKKRIQNSDYSAFKAALDNGDTVSISWTSPGGGHALTVVGYGNLDGDGQEKFAVYNPWGTEKHLTWSEIVYGSNFWGEAEYFSDWYNTNTLAIG